MGRYEWIGQILETEAATLDGFHVKLRAIEWTASGMTAREWAKEQTDSESWLDARIGFSALADAIRLLAAGGTNV